MQVLTLVRRSVQIAITLTGSAFFALPANASPPSGTPVDGIRCEGMEGTALHIHQHLTIADHGRPVPVPEDVGRPLAAQCFYWLHTHTPDGIIHVEAPVARGFTLGQFFAVWGEPLSRTRIASAKLRPGEHLAIWINGSRYEGDPRAIPLFQHSDITIEVGPPYARPAPFTAWGSN